MAENKNKNEYSTGFSNNTYSFYPDLDFEDEAPKKAEDKVEKVEAVSEPALSVTEAPARSVAVNTPAPVDNQPAVDEKISEPVTAESSATTPTQEQPKKKSPLFGLICAVLIIAVIATSTLSALNISKALNSVSEDETPVSSDNTDYNIYTGMVAKYKATSYPTGIPQSLVKTYAANNDVVGWLYIPGTNVNTPIVQSKDNNHYLRYNFYGSNTKYGTTYVDYRCKKNTLSTNTVIYGHNMPSGTHFYDVHRYEDIEWYKKHPVINYTTINADYTFLVYTAFYTTGKVKYNGGYFFNYIYPNMGTSSMTGYIEQVNQRAIYTTGIDLKPTDKIITLSTCTHSLDAACGTDIDGRLVVIGRLLRAGESAEVDTSKAKANSNYRRPQIWYDKKGKTNPYAKSNTWQPSQK